ncbi:hypothetical protein UFOVP137_2 [uncultured Caudovirales phage]|uniref:Uncharacterized protein n=1 Tax=uncultured Caudovirales phage TaxID=2100421 RepID=A0A6J5LC63_9CAUD|nr:hypothetical protein UFOVP137_2 [uncultured Caudovirales phage]
MILIKLVFFSWLAILAGMTWTTDGILAGEVSKALLCGVAFLGGLAGTWMTLHSEMKDEA